MGRLVLGMSMSLDGFFCGPNGELDWMSSTSDKELSDDTVAFFSRFDEGFIGYPTGIGMVPYWQHVANSIDADEEDKALARAVNRLKTIIVSNKEEHLPWDGVVLVAKNDDELVKAVNAIKIESNKDLGLPGGIRTAQTFIRLGLVDEYAFTIHSVAIGKGKQIFTSRVDLELINHKMYPSGVARVNYRAR